ncbi:TOMM precursor leader peptide-binding protein [Sorangium sp. So ce1128]
MHRVLQFKPHLRPERAGDDLVVLLGEREQFLLKGRLYALLAPLIDGVRTRLELITALSGQAPPTDVHHALTRLEERGYVIEATPGVAPEIAAFWHAAGLDAAQAAAVLQSTPVAVRGLGAEDPAQLAQALIEAGAVVTDADAALHVTVVSDYLDPALDAWCREARARRQRWTLIKPAGLVPWVGPIFRPDGGACWACLAHRLRANRPAAAFVQRRTGSALPLTPPRAASPASVGMALRFAALALARWIAEGQRGPIDAHLLTLTLAGEPAAHAVTRRPQCPVCGDPELLRRRALEPPSLSPRPKRFTDDGGHRTRTPDETLALLAPQISPITGVLSASGPVEGIDHPLRPVYGAAFPACPADGALSTEHFERRANGKGRTRVQAHASALCEAIERYSAVFQGDEPLRRGRLADLGDEGLHPAKLLNFSEAQLRARDALNAQIKDPAYHIPLPFDERLEIDWTPAWSLTDGRRRYLPAAYCYIDPPTPSEKRFFCFNSNGHSAGNCLEEAILQGFLELVERDAFAVYWYNRVRRPAVALDGFGEPYFGILEEHYRSMGWSVWVLDITHDLQIPTFVALARNAESGRHCVGFGCHLEARLGVQRALTELNQLFDPGGEAPLPWDPAELDDASFLIPDDRLHARRARDFSEVSRDDVRDDVLACVELARRAGLEILVLDQSRPDTGLCAVKVVVPGLRHYRPQLAPGRLYDVPVRMGWRERPLAEADLNPARLFPS